MKFATLLTPSSVYMSRTPFPNIPQWAQWSQRKWNLGFKALLQLANFTLGPDATLNTEIHKSLVRIKAPNSVSASKWKHKNQINHYNKQGRVIMANSTVCQSKWKSIMSWTRRAKPKAYRQAPTHWLKFYEEAVIESEARTAKPLPFLLLRGRIPWLSFLWLLVYR